MVKISTLAVGAALLLGAVIAQEAPDGATCSQGKKTIRGMKGATASCECINEDEDLVFKVDHPVLHDSEAEADGHPVSCDVNGCGGTGFKEFTKARIEGVLPPDSIECCNDHDENYCDCSYTKEQADEEFLTCMYKKCDTYFTWNRRNARCKFSAKQLGFRAVFKKNADAFYLPKQAKNCECRAFNASFPHTMK